MAKSQEKAKKSEMHGELNSLVDKYLSFAAGVASKLEYTQVPHWIEFSKGNVKDALAEKRTNKQLLTDYYVIYFFSVLMNIIASWPVLLLFGIYGAVLGGVVTVAAVAAASATGSLLLLLAGILVAFIGFGIFIAIVPALLFAFTLIPTHIAVKIAGGKGSLNDTANMVAGAAGASVIAMIPMNLLQAALIGYLLGPLIYIIDFYCLYLFYKGVREVHSLSQMRSIAAIIISWVLMAVLLLLLIGAVYAAFMLGWIALAASLVAAPVQGLFV